MLSYLALQFIDDTGFPKQGRHSVGVARQYCGMLGKQDNCQVAVSVSLACEAASVPVAWQLYLPREWADDAQRREKAGVPQALQFATKPQIALRQIEHLMGQGAPRHCVLADAGYGIDTAFRERLSELGLRYAVGVTGSVTVWPPGREPLPPAAYSGLGNVPTRLRLGGKALPQHQPQSIKELALELGPEHWHTVAWREGTNARLSSRFARVRVRAAHATVGVINCAHPNGCSSSGPRVMRSRSSTGCPPYPRTWRWSAWCSKPRCVGASSAAAGGSSASKTSAWGTTKAGAGGAFIITPA